MKAPFEGDSGGAHVPEMLLGDWDVASTASLEAVGGREP